MPLEIRPITPDEFVAFNHIDGAAFGYPPDAAEIDSRRPLFEFDRSLVAVDGGEFVGSAGAFSFELTLPGGVLAPVAGVTWVAVLPTHRRQGVLTTLMRHQLDDVARRGEPLAVLTASESVIYGRFGYGMATSQAWYEIDRRHASLRNRGDDRARDAGLGRVRLIAHEAAVERFATLYDRWRLTQPGAVSRSAAYWQWYLRNPLAPVEGSGGRLYLIYETARGDVEGIAHYRVKNTWEGGIPAGVLTLRDLFATTDAAYAALWEYCLSVDLIQTVRANGRTVDEPLRWMLADPRRLQITRLVDDLWVRVLDVSAALSWRRYAASGQIVFDVRDAFRPETSGRYLLDATASGAECARTTADPDLALDIADLGAAYLGGVRFATLARAGRVQELRPGALVRADTLFATDPAPWCGTPF